MLPCLILLVLRRDGLSEQASVALVVNITVLPAHDSQRGSKVGRGNEAVEEAGMKNVQRF